MSSGVASNLEQTIELDWPATQWLDTHVVVAVSGGPDSTALLCALAELKRRLGGKGSLFAAHLNHQLRGTAADEDQVWLQALCSRLAVPFAAESRDVARAAESAGDGWEAAARALRYEFLLRTAERVGARFVATGHTADDQVESVLQRILRGTGLAGLAGIPRVRPLSPSVTVVRPILSLRRQDVLSYLAELSQPFRVDKSNADARFTRNRLRNDLLPLLRCDFNAEVDASLLRLSQQAAEAQQFIAEYAAEFRPVGNDDPTRLEFDCQCLSGQPELIIREVIKSAWTKAGWPQQAMGFAEWQQLAEMAGSDAKLPTFDLPGGVRAERIGSDIILTRSSDFS